MGILYDAVLVPRLLCKFTCLANGLCDNFILILHRSDLDIHRKLQVDSGIIKKVSLNLVVFLTVQVVNLVNAQNVNVAVPQSSIFLPDDIGVPLRHYLAKSYPHSIIHYFTAFTLGGCPGVT